MMVWSRRVGTSIWRRALLVVACVATMPVSGVAMSTPPEVGETTSDVGDLLEGVRSTHEVPAMAGLLFMGDEIRMIGEAGTRQRDGEHPVGRGDPWHLGSCTKAMTATMIARLVQDGALSWETTLGEVFGDTSTVHPGFEDVTVRALLCNRGGCSGRIDPDLWSELWHAREDPVGARRRLAEVTLASAPAVTPGTYEYSNTGFAIAGHMAEVRTGESWEALMGRLLFEPLGMSSAGFGHPGAPGEVEVPWGHDHRAKGPIAPGRLVDNPPAIGPAGTVHATIEDWARFAHLHLRAARGEEIDLLDEDSVSMLHTPWEGGTYACGWGVLERPWAGASKRVLTHTGSNNAWFCVVWIAPDLDMGVLVTCNAGGDSARRATDEAAWAMIRRALEPASP